MEADFDIFFRDFEHICGIARAHILYVAQDENSTVRVWQLFDCFFQQCANFRV